MAALTDLAAAGDPSADIARLARAVLTRCRERGLRLATAESCTGGLVIASLTAIEGSSDVVDRGFITYANAAKTEMLAVPEALIAEHGAVSEPVARAMAEGALRAAAVDLAVAVSGIAGPGGAVPGKPVGTVHLAVARRARPTRHRLCHFTGSRAAIREASIAVALEMFLDQLT